MPPAPIKRNRSVNALLAPTAAAVLAMSFAAPLSAQTIADPLALPPQRWAGDACNNEVSVIQYGHSYLRYRMHTRDSKGDQVREVIESKDGTVARLLFKEGHPLTAEEDAAEHERLQDMLDSPAAFARHTKNDASGKKMGVDMIKLMPAAMLFSYAPGQPQRANRSHADAPAEIVLDFKPNPDWTPPNMEAAALTGLQGRAWIDPGTRYITRIEGDIFRGVNFGFGVFAHIYPGGHLDLDQAKVSGQRWIFTHFKEAVAIRVIVKTIKENSDIEASNFAPVPEMNYQDAIHALLATPLPAH